jgi:hypothetical protein
LITALNANRTHVSAVKVRKKRSSCRFFLEIERRGHMSPNLYLPRVPQGEISADDRLLTVVMIAYSKAVTLTMIA